MREQAIFEDAVVKANEEVNKKRALRTYFIDREKALRMPG